MSAVASAGGVMVAYKALQNLVSGLQSFASSSIQSFSHFESMQKGLETFFQSAEKGKSVFEDLRKLSNQTTFGVDELANSATQLLNTGTSAEKLNQTLIMLGNTAQGDKAKFADLTSIFAKIQSTGKAGSMQLQQLAMRGLPIYDVLKKIGVTGTASAQDITRAFQEMTKKGGQFYNAMNNINDTIEGKEGFISDYFKELKVNFAEVTGLADAYKNVLDILKEAIGKVSDALLAMNSNPFTKALFTGAIVGTITAIAGVLGGVILTSLKAITAELKLQSIYTAVMQALKNPAGLGLTLAIAGVAGLTAGMISLFNATKKAKEEVESLNNSVASPVQSKNYANNEITRLNSNIEAYITEIEKENAEIEQLKERLKKARYSTTKKNIKDEIEEHSTVVQNYEKALENAKKAREALRGSASVENQLDSAPAKKTSISEIFANTDIGKTQTEIEELKNSIKEIEDMANETIGDSGIKLLDNESLEKAGVILDELKAKLAKLEMKDWQKTLRSGFGFSDKDVANGAVNSTMGAVDYYQKQMANYNSVQSKFADVTGYTDRQGKQETYQGMLKAFQDILASVKDGTYTGSEESLDEFAGALRQAKADLEEYDWGLVSWINDLANSNNIIEQGIGKVAQKSGDINAFAEGASQGGIWGGIISTILNALMNVCEGIDGFDEAINPVTTLFENLSVVIRFFMSIISSFVRIIESIAKVINSILKALYPAIWIIQKFVECIAYVIEEIADAFGSFVDDVFDWADAFKEDEEDLDWEELVQQYANLITAMREMEEYYDERKAKNRGTQAISNATSVHDMILTPQGNFSTDPDDYIIATKNPSGLNSGSSGGVVMNVKIENNASNVVSATATKSVDENGIESLIVQISQNIASDYANGKNGWDSAIMARNYNTNGRSVAI